MIHRRRTRGSFGIAANAGRYWRILRARGFRSAAAIAAVWPRKSAVDEASIEPPLRAELFSSEQMAQHGKALAASHRLSTAREPDRLLTRLDDNEQVLLAACQLLTLTVQAKLPLAPAGEWLLDNFHIVDEQIRAARRHLPKNYSRELPRLDRGPSRGLPRVYDLALEAISHGDGRVDEESLTRFVAAYQTVATLQLGELWAIPIMLRLALIENLRRVAARISATRLHLNLAQDWADRMMEVASRDPKSLILVIADMARSEPPMASSFVAELTRRLQGHGPALALPLTWIEQRLAESSLTIELLVQIENQQQSADQLSISNTIGSLRFVDTMDWRDFVEDMSAVERILRSDGVYGDMDFATRDSYRHVVDRLAKRCGLPESEVAQLAMSFTQRADAEPYQAHVGYYLIDDRGLRQLEAATKVSTTLRGKLRLALSKQPFALHIGAIVLITALVAGGLLLPLRDAGVPFAALIAFAGLLLLAASQLGSALGNWFASLLVQPRRLPRMDYALGLPAPLRTLVVVPTLLTSAEDIAELLEALEVRFLGNRDEVLHFGLLSDFRDAASETLAEDAALLSFARAGIERLNETYPNGTSNRFFLFHRARRWNAAEQAWMGFERKRGKLADLNALLRGEGADRFALIVGDFIALPSVKYVITLDTDTQLPRDAARQFVGTMAHPLNQPRYDARRQRVCGGYGILQPRMAASLAGAHRTRYAQLFGSEPGIDPYTRSASDVYQDLFGEGSFIGKGIYEVDAFEHAIKDRFPDNRILSHDLLEGCYARCGLLSDVHLYEAHPARYQDDTDRHHRWIRGDWQIARWLLPTVPGADGHSAANPLSALSRWKIFDNLRRSLAPAATLLMLLLGWALLPQPWLWTAAALGMGLLPTALSLLLDLVRKPEEVLLRQHLAAVLRSAARGLATSSFKLACLPHEVFIALDAILRTLWRVLVSGRRLLEWRVSSGPSRRPGTGLAAVYRSMWAAPLTAAVAGTIALLRPEAGTAIAPLLLLWATAPALASWLSRPLQRRAAHLSDEQTLFLRRIARKTWAYFEQFVVADSNWLPPDNFQESPGPVIAHRTSPTNIGMALLANLSAYDFGYASAGTLLQRTAATFGTLHQLARYQGHFYNWYHTQTLQPLPPRYVSTVDSGNLVGHLLTLRSGLLALAEQPIVSVRLFEGLADTLSVLAEHALPDEHHGVLRMQTLIERACTQPLDRLSMLLPMLETLADTATQLADGFEATPETEASFWASTLARQCREAIEELRFLAPWLDLGAMPNDDAATPFALPAQIDRVLPLQALAAIASTVLPLIDARLRQPVEPALLAWLMELQQDITAGAERAAERIERAEALAHQAATLADIEYEFLYDRGRHLLAVGYNVDEYRRDAGYYDLLASEARLGNFVAIAQGKLPQESWFALGRLLTSAGGAPILVSWSGSMFEYLMPLLVMPGYDGSLLDQTCRAAVDRQIAYGKQRALPWGVSESGYYALDAGLNYQYHAFGVPGLGLKRGLAEELVIAPYASALALMVAPEAACANLQRLSDEGVEGRFGFYEAVDYTPVRLPRGSENGVVVRSFMAHHQGMSLLSLASLLLGQPMQRRFEAEPLLQATLLLLQEKIPKTPVLKQRTAHFFDSGAFVDSPANASQATFGPQTTSPEVQLLSNGRYHVMVSNAGGGYSRWKDLAITRWREDGTCDNWGSFIYLRDVSSGHFWSAAHQPTLKRAESYEAVFSEERAEYRRRDHEYEVHSEIVVSPEDDIELRRLRVTNRARTRRTIEITSYAEVVLAPPAADAMQPSFGNLFVQTEIVDNRHAILCTRRPRSADEPTPWMFHLVALHGASPGAVSYETDRLRFVGRGNSLARPQAMRDETLSGSQGSVLDPIVSIRCSITLEAGQSVTLDWITGAADNREACMALVDRYQDRALADRVLSLAWTHGGVMLRQINVSDADAQLYRRISGAVIYAQAWLRAEPGTLIQNRRGQSGLWGYAISGDLPIVLLKIADLSQLEVARQLIQCHAYWRLKGLHVDLVIWNEDHIGYRQRLQDQIMGMIGTSSEAQMFDRPGGIFVRSAEQISSEDRILLQAVARVIVSGDSGSLTEQLHLRAPIEATMARLAPTRRHVAALPQPPPSEPLQLENGNGGFSADGREYHITTTAQRMTPLPWVNVIANANFGSVVTESGLAYTWAENAHEYRLTPWNDDPVGASGGEAYYLRDEETGHFWSPTPMPSRGVGAYRTRHGFGYSVFEHVEDGIESELWVYVDLEASVKFSVLKLRNSSARTRKLSATGYVEWVLGDLRPKTAMHVVTEIDAGSGALFARNAYSAEFGGRVAFFDIDDLSRTLTGDRSEFIGRNGRLGDPDVMTRTRLSGRIGAGLDPCGAIQVTVELQPGQERQLVFRLGAAPDLEQARTLARRLRKPGTARAALENVQQHWQRVLGAVQIETPEPAVNLLANGWLLYQTLACRFWARSGFYQSGGAYGFRDQLQDTMALMHAEPRLARDHLLRSAERQYLEGDVQHWWHPPVGRGVRTRCSDDFLWLPLVACRYVEVTGDIAVLDENLHFLEGRALHAGEESYYDLPQRSSQSASLYQHCVRALEHGLRFGERGLPLMGSGDWNDGMNLVGIEGRGESVWLGFFLFEVLNRFAELAERCDDASYAAQCRAQAETLRANLHEHAWDGAWYRRAYFDDGTPLGSSTNSECAIDSVSQSWSVLSGAGDPERARHAMDEVDRRLVRREHGLIQLLDPPFDTSPMNPGYIKGYVPGVRENGGQYTHAAIWTAMAFARLGDGRRAWELLALINPLNHTRDAREVALYKAEPYVVAADVYGVAPHTGRGGWSWYTGSAGWMYRLIVESLLGLRREGERLHIAPLIPQEWPGFSLRYRYCATEYRIEVRAVSADAAVAVEVHLDGWLQAGESWPLVDDGQPHQVTVNVRSAV